MIKRRYDLIKKKMDNLFDNCGATSFFVFATDISYENAQFHSFAAPSGSHRRPAINQQTINSIAKSLQNSLKYHQGNVNYYDPDSKVTISKEAAFCIIKR